MDDNGGHASHITCDPATKGMVETPYPPPFPPQHVKLANSSGGSGAHCAASHSCDLLSLCSQFAPGALQYSPSSIVSYKCRYLTMY